MAYEIADQIQQQWIRRYVSQFRAISSVAESHAHMTVHSVHDLVQQQQANH